MNDDVGVCMRDARCLSVNLPRSAAHRQTRGYATLHYETNIGQSAAFRYYTQPASRGRDPKTPRINVFGPVVPLGTTACRYSWLSAGSTLGWPFPMIKYKYIFQIKYTHTHTRLTAPFPGLPG